MEGTGRSLATLTVLLCFALHLYLHSVNAETTESLCPTAPPPSVKGCECKPAGNAGDGARRKRSVADTVGIPQNGQDMRTIGLAGAAGTLGGIMLVGGAIAAFVKCTRSGACGKSPDKGGGAPENGLGSKDKFARPDSSSSYGSNSTCGSESPLAQKGDHTPRLPGGRYPPRPTTGMSVGSTGTNYTNIYRQAKVWPGKM